MKSSVTDDRSVPYLDLWWPWSGPLHLHEWWSTGGDRALCPWWQSKTGEGQSKRCSSQQIPQQLCILHLRAPVFTLLVPLNSSWSKSKCRQRAPTVNSDRRRVGLLAARVELLGSSWCWVLSFARAPTKSYAQTVKTKEKQLLMRISTIKHVVNGITR